MRKKLVWIALTCAIEWAGAALASEPTRVSVAESVAAPVFSVAADGGQIKLDDFKGKVVLLDFWASWCGPCRHAFPWLNEIQARYGDEGLVVLGVNLDEDRDAALRFLKVNPAVFSVGFDPQGKVAETYQLKGMPSSYVIDREGRLRLSHIGFRERDKAPYVAQIQAILRESRVTAAH